VADFTDRTLKCVECGAIFVFTAREQEFFAERNFQNDPKRCKDCKAKRKKAAIGADPQKPENTITCSQCGREAKVPFRPAPGRPIFCHECFQKRRGMGPGLGRLS